MPFNAQRLMLMLGYVATKMELQAGYSAKGNRYRLVKFALRDPWNPDSEFVKCVCFGSLAKWCEDNLDGRINQLVLAVGNWKRCKSKDGKKEWIEFLPESIAMIGPKAQVLGPATNFKADAPVEVSSYVFDPPDRTVDSGGVPWEEDSQESTEGQE